MVGRPSPLTVGAGAGGALGLRPAFVYQIPSQPVLHSVILSSKQRERWGDSSVLGEGSSLGLASSTAWF